MLSEKQEIKKKSQLPHHRWLEPKPISVGLAKLLNMQENLARV